MSALRIVSPLENLAGVDGLDDEPDVLPFPQAATAPQMNVVERARSLFNNRRCRTCGYPVVLPIELDDALVNRCGQKIPGTATLVGFRCCGCQSEWST
uniref:Uncharacterized protein n=1 Tax=Schlesneria paludicola TaxID=360056 RepID=A0A7C2P214_9PLAN